MITQPTPPASKPADYAGDAVAYNASRAAWYAQECALESAGQPLVDQHNTFNQRLTDIAATTTANGNSVLSTSTTTLTAVKYKGTWQSMGSNYVGTGYTVLHRGVLWLCTADIGTASTDEPGVSNKWFALEAQDVADRTTTQPTLDLDFARQRYRMYDAAAGGLANVALGSVLTYTGIGRTYTAANGALVAQSSNVPRIEFDPATGAGLGLSVYEAHTNLFTRSQEFDHADWSKTNLTITANATTAPDGTTTADRLVETAVNGGHYAEQIKNNTVTAPVTVSWFVKAGERTIVNLENYSSPTTSRLANVQFNASTGTFGAVTALGGASGVTTKSELIAGGWYRIRLTVTFGGTDTQSRHRITLVNASNQTVYTGDGTSGLFVWGAQVGPKDGPYIPTAGAAVTAPADVPTLTGTNFSKWFNPAEGTLVVLHRRVPTIAGHAAVAAALGDPSKAYGAAETMFVSVDATSGGVNAQAINAGVVTSVLTATSVTTTAGELFATVMAYAPNAHSLTARGSIPVTDTLTPIPLCTALSIGSAAAGWSGGANHVNSTIARVLYFPKRLNEMRALGLN